MGQNGGGIVYIHIKGSVTYNSGGIDASGAEIPSLQAVPDGGGGGLY